MIYLWVSYMFYGSVFSILYSVFLMLNDKVFFIEFNMLSYISMKFDYLIMIDWRSVMFIGLVLLISSMVFFYSMEYMLGDKGLNRFMFKVLLFVISMILMIISPSMVSILMGWDGLGLISYCLVIYYQNETSFNSGMVTVLTNRIGDVLILILIGLMVSLGSWSFMFLNSLNNYMLLMIMLVSFTKSAQIPFSSWLPMAMAAPTPVSSLVHSSTLVTAGVYLLIRFNYVFNNMFLNKIMMFISVMTLFLSGVSANFENDLKKIIALSTLSQLGVMIFCLSMGLSEYAYFHLLSHALFKSTLFMCAGLIIHNFLGSQDIRFINMVYLNFPLVSMIFNCCSLSLCGLFFLSGFYSKDLILEMFLMNLFNKIIFLILFISMGLTVMYSFRLMYFSFIKLPIVNNLFVKYDLMKSFMMWSMLILYFLSIMAGSMLSWMIFSMKNLIFLSLSFKLLILYFMGLGMFLGSMLFLLKKSKKFLIYMNLWMSFFLMMWFMPMIYGMYTNKLMIFSNKFNYISETGWNEMFLGGKNFNIFLMKISIIDLFSVEMLSLMNFIMYMLIIMMF